MGGSGIFLKERNCPNSWEIWHGNSVIGLIATGLDIDEDNQRIFPNLNS